MKKITRAVAVLLSIFLICIIFTLVGCVEHNTNNNVASVKYDVAVMIVRRETTQQYPTEERWFVDADKSSIDIEQLYDGKAYVYYVYAYNLPEHPEFGDVWFLYDKSSSVGFAHNQYERKEHVEGSRPIRYLSTSVSQKGEYTMDIYASKNSLLWNGKLIQLRITVK